jgi:hypothetical protein
MNYEGLDFSREELVAAMREYYEELLDFISTPPFPSIYREMMALPPQDRPRFVSEVILRREELERRGVKVSEGILIQTSAFGDRRPTLFCVKKYLPTKFHKAWENVNLTFFNEFNEEDVPNDIESSWRPPLPVALQQALLASGVDLNSVPKELGINYELFKHPAAKGGSG